MKCGNQGGPGNSLVKFNPIQTAHSTVIVYLKTLFIPHNIMHTYILLVATFFISIQRSFLLNIVIKNKHETDTDSP